MKNVRKWILFALIFTILTACNTSGESAYIKEIAKSLDIQIKEFNQANAYYLSQIEKLEADTVKLLKDTSRKKDEQWKEKILAKIDEQKDVISNLTKKVDSIQSTISDVKEKIATLKDETSKKQAVSVIQSFNKVHQSEKELLKLNEQYLQLQKEYISNMTPEKQKKIDDLKKEMDISYKNYQNEVVAFNDQWKQFVEDSVNGVVDS